MWAVGMTKAKASRHTARRTSHCRRTQPADSPPGTGLKTNSQQSAGLSPAVQVDGGSAVVLAARKAGADLPNPVSTPPIAFACPYPLP